VPFLHSSIPPSLPPSLLAYLQPRERKLGARGHEIVPPALGIAEKIFSHHGTDLEGRKEGRREEKKDERT